MMYFTENNWCKWNYDDGEYFTRTKADDEKFATVYDTIKRPVGTLWDEAVLAAKTTMQAHPGTKPKLFFSGGVDSEIMVRAFLEINAKPEIYIVRYEDDINIKDVSYAISNTLSLGQDYKIIDFNLKKFFENEAEQIADEAQCDRPRMLPQITFGNYVDGLSILCMADISWMRDTGNYAKPGEWLAVDVESDCAIDRYSMFHDRESIGQWNRWSPGLLLAHTKWNWFKLLTQDCFENKRGISSTKMTGFREEFPFLQFRHKYVGFEKCEPLIAEFERWLYTKNNGLWMRREHPRTIEQLWLEATGYNYER